MAQTIEETTKEMQKVLDHLQDDIKKIRTGRANASVLDGVMVEAYGRPMPLKHLANVAVLDAQTLQVTPFDPNNLVAISTAISQSNLGLNPSDNGHVVRVPVPLLTTERRQELVAQLGEKTEEARISLRNVRHELLNSAKADLKDSKISEDDYSHIEKQADELISEYNDKVDAMHSAKEAEIMQV